MAFRWPRPFLLISASARSITIYLVDANLKIWNVMIHTSLGNKACFRFPVITIQEGLAKLLHDLTFGPYPVAQGASRTASLGEPEFARPLLDVRLNPKMLFRGQDNRRGKVRVDQQSGIFILIPLPRVGPAIRSRLTVNLPAHPPLNGVRL